MFKNHLKIAWRSLQKNKSYTIINLVGLTIGIAAALLIFRMVSYELSFNKDFAQYDRIVRVVSVEKNAEEGESYSVCIPVPAMDVMESEVSQFAAISRVHEAWTEVIVPNPAGGAPLKKFGLEPGQTAFFTETEFFEIFNFEWLAGDSNTALDDPGTIVLTQSWAEKLFGNWQNALEQTVLLDNQFPATVKGVIADLPSNVDFNFPYLVSYPTLESNADYYFYDKVNWNNCSSNNQVYALLQDSDRFDDANALLSTIGAGEYSEHSGQQERVHQLQPLSDLHYSERYSNSGNHRTSRSRLRILGGIGILILIMACFNFINLATAQASMRAKEVGVRKTLGSRRSQLVSQFMSETGLIVAGAVFLGLVIATATSPLLKYISDVPDSLPFLSQPAIWLFLGLTTIVVTLLAGLYPSMALASFKPVQALRNNSSRSLFGGILLRKSLVVLQFVIAQGLIVGAIITILQLDYIRSRDLGFSQDLVYAFELNADSTTIARQTALRQRIISIPTVESMSFNSDQPLSGNTWTTNFRYNTRPEDEPYGLTLKFADASYGETYGIELLAGRWYHPSDTMREAVVNATLIKKLGLTQPEAIIGQNIQLGSRSLKVVGVTEDFHTHSLRRAHLPLLLTTRKEFYWEAGVKIRPTDVAGTSAAIRAAFDEVLPEQVFAGRFLDENIAQFYENDNRLAATCKAFGLLAILISCLGLFGLATHAAARRTKEIGIRKVLGASAASLLALLSREFLQLVVVALLIASPIAWLLMSRWLENFVYRIDIQWWVFALAGLVAVLIAFVTVSFQSVKAALANPVNALKQE